MGGPARQFSSTNRPGPTRIAVAAGVKKALKEIEPRLPEDVAYDVMYDTTVFVEAMIHKVQKTLIEAFVLVGIVVFIFLGSLRATLIPIIAVPVALVGTLCGHVGAGLLGQHDLATRAGAGDRHRCRRCDRRRRGGRAHPGDRTTADPAEAAEKAMSQVTAPIIAITLVLLSVFVPTAFIPGITGQLYQQFAVAVSVSMIISAINALSLSPALCALLLRHRGHRARTDCLFPAWHRPEPRRIFGTGATAGATGADNRSAGGRLCTAQPAGWQRSCLRASCPKRTRAHFSPTFSCRMPRR